jgi:D-amino-acid dehydrogenase
MSGLETWLSERGVEVDRRRQVTGFSARGGTVHAVRTEKGRLLADAVVIAAGAWSGPLARRLGLRLPLQAGKGYSFSVDLGARPRAPLYLLEGRVAVTEMAGRVRCAGMMELSGVDPRVDPRRLRALARHASAYLQPWPGDDTVTEAWAGLRPMTPDGLPVIGFVPGTSNALLATGHAMLGVTLGPTTGEAVADLLDGKEDERLAPFSPARF